MAFVPRSQLERKPYMRPETWKQIFQKYDSIPDSLGKTIVAICEKIERHVWWDPIHEHSKRKLSKIYEDFGKELLSSKDTPDWENVAENLNQMYDEYQRACEEKERRHNIQIEPPRYAEQLVKTESYKGYRSGVRFEEETIPKHMSPDVGQSVQDDVEPKQFVVQSLQEDEDPNRKIQIKVKTLQGVKHILRNVATHDSVLDLKGKIASKVGCKTEGEVILMYDKNELCDGNILATYGITSGATINMLPRVHEKGLIESAMKILKDSRNVMKHLEKWIPELFVETSRQVTEIELGKIVHTIGENWELLGVALGLDKVKLQHISADNNTMIMKIYCMLTTWLELNQSNATFRKLYETMRECRYRNTVSFNWEKVKRIFASV